MTGTQGRLASGIGFQYTVCDYVFVRDEKG